MEIMERLGKIVTRFPKQMIAAIIIVTIILGAALIKIGISNEMKEGTFFPENETVDANFKIEDEYGVVEIVPILVEGKDRDVITVETVKEMLEIEWAIYNDTGIKNTLSKPNSPSESIISTADIIMQYRFAVVTGEYDVLVLAPSFKQKLIALNGGKNINVDGVNMSKYLDTGESEDKSAVVDFPKMKDKDVKDTFNDLLNDERVPALMRGQIIQLFTKDFTNTTLKAEATMIIVNLNASELEGESEDDYDERFEKLETRMVDIIDSRNPESDFSVVGGALIGKDINKASDDSMKIIMPLAFGLLILILAITYRNLLDVILSLLSIVFALIWTYSICTILGFTFNPLTVIVPVLILGLGIDYGIHLVMRYREEREAGVRVKESVGITIQSVGMALLLATGTTIVSFLSNISSSMGVIREFGIMCAIGILSSFFIMATFLTAVKQVVDERKEKRVDEDKVEKKKSEQPEKDVGVRFLDNFLAKGAVGAEHHPKGVIAAVIVVTMILGSGALRLESSFNIEDFLPEELEISKDIKYMANNFNSTREEADILIEGKNMADVRILKAIDETVNNMKDNKYTIIDSGEPRVESILSLMQDYAEDTTTNTTQDLKFDKEFRDLFEASDTDDDNIPDRDIEQLYDWLYEENEDTRNDAVPLLHRTDNEYDGLVIRIKINSHTLKKIKEVNDELNADLTPLNKLEEDGVVDNVVLTGGPVVIHVVMDSIENSMKRSLIITILISGIVLTIVFWFTNKSKILGFITSIPVFLVVIWILGTMYFVGIPLNVMTLMIAALTIGLGITYAIHITHRFVEDIGRIDDIDRACRHTVTNTGTALFGAAATTIGGFGMLAFSVMPPLQDFGVMTALMILYSFLASIFLLPTFLVLWAKYVKKKNPEYFGHHVDAEHVIEERVATDEKLGEAKEEGKVKKDEKEEEKPEEEEKDKKEEEAPEEEKKAGKVEGVDEIPEEKEPDKDLTTKKEGEPTEEVPDKEYHKIPEEKEPGKDSTTKEEAKPTKELTNKEPEKINKIS